MNDSGGRLEEDE